MQNVLVIDDDAALRDNLGLMLETEGFHPAFAATERTSARITRICFRARLITKLLVYGYCIGVFSSRRIQKRLREDIPFKVLAAGNEPDFRTISDFRKNHLEALQGLFEQVLEMAWNRGR
jgi:CheY-like chemotaxis protein